MLMMFLFLPEWLCAFSLPQRIVSLVPALTSEIYDLGAQDLLVGVTRYCPNPGGKKEVVGSLTELNFEKILTLKPDLILAGKDCNRKRDVEKLASLGMRLEVFDGCENFACMCTGFLRLGRLLGRDAQARRIIQDVKRQIGAIRGSLPKVELKVFWQVGYNPLVTVNDRTFAGEFIRLAGCRNIFGDVEFRYPRVNVEEVLLRDPDVIIVVSGMDSGNDPWRTVQAVKAVRTGRVYRIPADQVCQPTPLKFLAGFRTVAGVLFPGSL